MLKNLIKPASLLLYLLSILTFMLLGMTYAGVSGAGEGQGLAGGAIVFGYGVMAAGVALIAALLLAYQARHRVIVVTNQILAGLFVVLLAVTLYRADARDKARTSAVDPVSYTAQTVAQVTNTDIGANTVGLGFYEPDFYNASVLYFYGQPNLEKAVDEHFPTDSITFRQLEGGGFEIATAPPWLQPEHQKLDYDLLYFRVKSIGHELIEITVNTTTQQTAYVARAAGTIMYWPEFLLHVNSVEFLDPAVEKVRYKAHPQADAITTAYDFMDPLLIQEDWMWVELRNDRFESLGKGWIQWRRNGQWLIAYSLFS